MEKQIINVHYTEPTNSSVETWEVMGKLFSLIDMPFNIDGTLKDIKKQEEISDEKQGSIILVDNPFTDGEFREVSSLKGVLQELANNLDKACVLRLVVTTDIGLTELGLDVLDILGTLGVKQLNLVIADNTKATDVELNSLLGIMFSKIEEKGFNQNECHIELVDMNGYLFGTSVVLTYVS